MASETIILDDDYAMAATWAVEHVAALGVLDRAVLTDLFSICDKTRNLPARVEQRLVWVLLNDVVEGDGVSPHVCKMMDKLSPLTAETSAEVAEICVRIRQAVCIRSFDSPDGYLEFAAMLEELFPPKTGNALLNAARKDMLHVLATSMDPGVVEELRCVVVLAAALEERDVGVHEALRVLRVGLPPPQHRLRPLRRDKLGARPAVRRAQPEVDAVLVEEHAAVVLERLEPDEDVLLARHLGEELAEPRHVLDQRVELAGIKRAGGTKGVATPAFLRAERMAQRPRRVARRHDALERGQVRRAERGIRQRPHKGRDLGPPPHGELHDVPLDPGQPCGAVHEQDALRVGTRNCIT